MSTGGCFGEWLKRPDKNDTENLGRGRLIFNYGSRLRAGLLRCWLAKHRGVNKYHLELYAMTFQFLHNRRDQDDFSKFCSVLAVVCA